MIVGLLIGLAMGLLIAGSVGEYWRVYDERKWAALEQKMVLEYQALWDERERERAISTGGRHVEVPMTDAELRRRGL